MRAHKLSFRWMFLAAAWMGVVALPFRSLGQAPGIYADFSTSLGSFTCQLDYQRAPLAVANFVGLATGEKAWLEETTGRVRQGSPFYNGLIFHRVIAGFVIQSGSPNGLGNDGLGYAFPDEFDPLLRHDAAGVLSSANSGPNSNGSQFFIIAGPAPWLDDVHTIFGRVVSGTTVVQAINQTPTENERPVTPVLIHAVGIRRVGAAAQAFDPHTQGLPIVSAVPLSLGADSGALELRFENSQYAGYRLGTSTNLAAWTAVNLGIQLGPPRGGVVVFQPGESRRFFRLARVQYPASTWAPATLRDRTITFTFAPPGPPSITARFDSDGGGTYTFPPSGSGAILFYS